MPSTVLQALGSLRVFTFRLTYPLTALFSIFNFISRRRRWPPKDTFVLNRFSIK